MADDGFEDDIDELLSLVPLEDICHAEVNCNFTDIAVEVPETFQFPFTPYDIQVGFMKELFRTIELGRVGIFESPTGTGKSLSLICGALTWLEYYEAKKKQDLEQLLQDEPQNKTETTSSTSKGAELDWINDFAKKQLERETTTKLKEEYEMKLKRDEKMKNIKNKMVTKGKRKRDKLDDEFTELMKTASRELQDSYNNEVGSECNDTDNEDDIILAEYHSDDECNNDTTDNLEEEEEHVTKIYFCSRTHSQLAQFVRELQKSPFGEETSTVSLGSRQNLCINSAVSKLKAVSMINDACLDMQKNKSGNSDKLKEAEGHLLKRKKLSTNCPYFKTESVTNFKDRVLAEVKDIEQLVTLGKEMKACPYYGTRHAIPAAQVVALPYNTLLHKNTRDATGIKLKGNIVIIDEAHNLVETISNVHSVEITGAQVTCAHSQLAQYFERYKKRLKAKNLMYIKQILFILSAIIKCLGGTTGTPADQQSFSKTETKLKTINDFLYVCQMDNLNLFKIMKYCQRSQISKKLHGFVEKYQPSIVVPANKEEASGLSKLLSQITDRDKPAVEEVKPAEPDKEQVTLKSPFMIIESFIEALTTSDKDGRIVIDKQSLLSHCTLKFLLLNPAVHFADIIKDARSVIVAGGTMQPISEFKQQLFFAAGAAPEKINEYSCGHVIPSEHLLPIALASGPTGVTLDFTYQYRDRPETMDEVGRLLCNICNVVPGGVVCFFPSYDYEKLLYTHLEKTGFLNRINAKKKVFREPRKAKQVDQVLNEYTHCIEGSKQPGNLHTGAILLCVVGGKMSEGINFSDDMGRCVVMVGLPYPNIRSPELKEKMDYLNATQGRSENGKLPGQIHYENLCMKAVNQSIGRAIRHKADYAAILLLDKRYQKTNIISNLPNWISEHVNKMDKFGPAIAVLKKFFADRCPQS